MRIDVTFEINTDGIVNVTARDPDSSQVASTQIHLSSGLTEQEIQALIDKHQPAAAPEPAPLLGAAAKAVAAAAAAKTVTAAAAAAPVATVVATDELDALASADDLDLEAAPPIGEVSSLRDEIEFDDDALSAAAATPIEGPADGDFDLDLEGDAPPAPIATDSAVGGGEREIDFEATAVADADPLDSLGEADLDSLASLSDDELAAPVDDEAPEASTMRRVRPSEDLFAAPGTDLSVFGDAEDDEI